MRLRGKISKETKESQQKHAVMGAKMEAGKKEKCQEEGIRCHWLS